MDATSAGYERPINATEIIVRSDSEVMNDVLSELRNDPRLAEIDIGLDVKDGLVTLRGVVTHHAERHIAEKLSRRVEGVMALANELTVRIPQPAERSDTELATAAVNAIKWNVTVSALGLDVVVRQGWIVLSGHVRHGFQKEAAESAVRYLLGVRGIVNEIVILPPVRMMDVKHRIMEAFRRQAHFDAGAIHVDLDGGRVTLSGVVHSWREKDDAASAAWSEPGVSSVENNISVA